MPKFPKAQADITALADMITNGLLENPSTFPAPPVSRKLLGIKQSAFINTNSAALSARAAAQQAVADKDAALAFLVEAMKANIRYAENLTGDDDAMLSLIGWGAKKSPTALTPPGQPLELKATTQGDGSLTLVWQAPPDGGKVAAYKVVRQIVALEEGDDGTVADVATAVDTMSSLTGQPLRKKLQYTIIAINKAGMGMPSNTIEVVL